MAETSREWQGSRCKTGSAHRHMTISWRRIILKKMREIDGARSGWKRAQRDYPTVVW
jgi:hypothetical protein